MFKMSIRMKSKSSSAGLSAAGVRLFSRLPDFLLKGDTGDNQPITAYGEYAAPVALMLAALEKQYGEAFDMYVSEDSCDDFWDFLEEDIKEHSTHVEWVSRIFEHIESRAFAYKGEECLMYPTIRNNLFYYPEWQVALARCPAFRLHGVGTEEYIFAPNDTALRRFLDYTRQRRRELKRGMVTVFKDGPDGMERELAPVTQLVEREDVVMSAEIADEIFASIDRFFSEDRSFYEQFRLPYKRGILLYGKPGNGKTTLVKSIAGSIRAPVAYWHITEFTGSSTIEEVFRAAVAMSPMVLVAEDIDSMPKSARSYFLNMLDGAVSREGIFLIGTTNYPENIDPALINRAGRFDRAYEVPLPDAAARREYLLRKGLSKLTGAEGIDEAAALTEGFTFAQLNELYGSAAMEWYGKQRVELRGLVRRMQEELEKGKSRVWLKEEPKSAVGFRVQ